MNKKEEQGDNRAAVYWEDIGGELFLIIRASSIGNPCLFELAAAGQGHDQVQLPGFMRRAFGEGHKRESEAIEKLKTEHAYVPSSAQVEGHLILPGNIMIRYHPDGVGFMPAWKFDQIHDEAETLTLNVLPIRCGIEVKWLRHESWLRASKPGGSVGDIVDEYKWQLSVMMYVEKVPFMWVAGNKGFPPDKDTGIKPYCEDEGKLFLEPVTEPPISLKAITEKAQKIKELVLGEDVMTGDLGCTSPDHFPCRYLHLRPEPEEDEVDENDETVLRVGSDTELGQQLDQDVREYLMFKGQMDEAKKRVDALKKRIIDQAGPYHMKIVTDRFVVPLRQNTYSKIQWDQMTPEEKEMFARFVEKKKTDKYIQGAKGLGM